MQMTERQRDVVAAIRAFWDMHGYGPTHRELARILDLRGTHSVVEHLTRLRVLGVVAWNERRARTIRLTEKGAGT